MAAQQTPLKVDPETDRIISQGAHFLGMTKKDLVAQAVREFVDRRREEIQRGVLDTMEVLDGSLASTVSLLSGLPLERLEEIGGAGTWED
jgi:hypothetical protein